MTVGELRYILDQLKEADADLPVYVDSADGPEHAEFVAIDRLHFPAGDLRALIISSECPNPYWHHLYPPGGPVWERTPADG